MFAARPAIPSGGGVRRRPLVSAGAALVVAASGPWGCKESNPGPTEAGPSAMGVPPVASSAPLVNAVPTHGYGGSDYGGAPTIPQPIHLPPPVESNSTITVTSSETVPGKPGTPPDPFAVATSEVQASSVGCFTGQPAGEYVATLAVAVTPTGTASRVEVDGVTDAGVKACLVKVAERKWPASAGGRKLRIEVRVKG